MAKNEDLVNVIGVKRCKASGVTIDKGDKTAITVSDARLLEAVGAVKYADGKDKPKTKGLTTESMKQK